MSMSTRTPVFKDHPIAALAFICLSAFAVTVDTTIVNVALPTLSSELDASTRDLQWVVDAYTLVFAAFVLAAGALGDRFGRREVLLVGLAVYGAANGAAALVESSDALIASRAVMGLGAAIIFPATLSTIVHLFPERGARAKAIGLWGATTGIAVALGPIVGGGDARGERLAAAFWLKVPVAAHGVRARARARADVERPAPAGARPAGPRVLERRGAGARLHHHRGARAGLARRTQPGGLRDRRILLFAVFVAYERRETPSCDVRLFRNGRLSAASLAITLTFFALFGFIFLITQYFQVLRGYEPFETGVRLLPVALSTGVASVAGHAARRAHRQQGRSSERARPDDDHVRLDLAGRRRDELSGDRRSDGGARHGDGPDHRSGHRVDHGRGALRQRRGRLGHQRHHA